MNNIYTYEVDHGNEAPSVGVGTLINGGELVGVSFTGQLSDNMKASELIDDILNNEELSISVQNKLAEIQSLI